jgi:hypothetical protein
VTRTGELHGDAATIGTLLQRNSPWHKCSMPRTGDRPTARASVRIGQFHDDMVTVWNLRCASAWPHPHQHAVLGKDCPTPELPHPARDTPRHLVITRTEAIHRDPRARWGSKPPPRGHA